MATKLNLGSGNSPKEGFTNIDLVDPCDLVVDLERDVWPFAEGTVDEIWAGNFFCMVSNIRHVMNEAHRVLHLGAKMTSITFDAEKYPHLYFQDPAHRRGFTRETYNYFAGNSVLHENFGIKYGYNPWNILEVKTEGSCLKVIWTPSKGGPF